MGCAGRPQQRLRLDAQLDPLRDRSASFEMATQAIGHALTTGKGIAESAAHVGGRLRARRRSVTE
ncbi:hypothetical protein ACIBQ1_03625 [Nonomuraea sp. NPDC050153]|uniref:hypothetical protein n=1 Tax=Nonomuraea sp. NPDC050153 TaxID=3364359 RepID=UPI00379D3B26